jgi:hypothetical protein
VNNSDLVVLALASLVASFGLLAPRISSVKGSKVQNLPPHALVFAGVSGLLSFVGVLWYGDILGGLPKRTVQHQSLVLPSATTVLVLLLASSAFFLGSLVFWQPRKAASPRRDPTVKAPERELPVAVARLLLLGHLVAVLAVIVGGQRLLLSRDSYLTTWPSTEIFQIGGRLTIIFSLTSAYVAVTSKGLLRNAARALLVLTAVLLFARASRELVVTALATAVAFSPRSLWHLEPGNRTPERLRRFALAVVLALVCTLAYGLSVTLRAGVETSSGLEAHGLSPYAAKVLREPSVAVPDLNRSLANLFVGFANTKIMVERPPTPLSLSDFVASVAPPRISLGSDGAELRSRLKLSPFTPAPSVGQLYHHGLLVLFFYFFVAGMVLSAFVRAIDRTVPSNRLLGTLVSAMVGGLVVIYSTSYQLRALTTLLYGIVGLTIAVSLARLASHGSIRGDRRPSVREPNPSVLDPVVVAGGDVETRS